MNISWLLKILALPVIGVALIASTMVMTMRAVLHDDIMTTQAPGVEAFEIKDSGSYTVWRTNAGVMNDAEFRVDTRELPAGLAMHIRRADDGTTVALRDSMGASKSRNDTMVKVSLAVADLEPGKYELVSTTNGEKISLSLSKSIGSFKGFVTGLGAFMLGVLLIVIGVIYAIVQIVAALARRKQSPPPANPPV